MPYSYKFRLPVPCRYIDHNSTMLCHVDIHITYCPWAKILNLIFLRHIKFNNNNDFIKIYISRLINYAFADIIITINTDVSPFIKKIPILS